VITARGAVICRELSSPERRKAGQPTVPNNGGRNTDESLLHLATGCNGMKPEDTTMQHAISNTGSLEASYYAAIDRDERRSLAFDLRSDQIRNDLTWQEIEEAMAEAPTAQRKEFWSQMFGLLEVEPRFIAKQNVSLMAGPLQEAVALAVDAQVRKEIGR
jgi:hypothetical protein